MGKQKLREAEAQGHISHKGHRYTGVGTHVPKIMTIMYCHWAMCDSYKLLSYFGNCYFGIFLLLTSEVSLLYESPPLGSN